MKPDSTTLIRRVALALMNSTAATIRSELSKRDGDCCSMCKAVGGGSVVWDNRRSRVVLDLCFLDGNPGNLGREGSRENVVLACQRCNFLHGMSAIAQAEEARRLAEVEAECGPELPMFG